MSEKFHCEVERRPEASAAVLRIAGHLAAEAVGDFEKAILPLAGDAGVMKIVLDGAKLAYIASAGLRGLLKAIKDLEKRGGRLYAVNFGKNVVAILRMTGFLSYMDMKQSVEECLK